MKSSKSSMTFLHFLMGRFFRISKAINPQPQIYQALMNQYQLKGHQSVFIDDFRNEYSRSENLGIEGIVCKNPAQVL